MKEAVEAYREEMDIVAEFVAECCTQQEAAEENTGDLYTAFQEWCMVRGEVAITSTAFGRRLEVKGFAATRTAGARKRKGLRLRVVPQTEAQRPAA
jgi:putative DNA primase/helicase